MPATSTPARGASARHRDEHRLPAAFAGRRAPDEHHDAPDRQRRDDRVPADPVAEPDGDIGELQRPGAIRSVGAVDHRGGEEEAGFHHRDGGRGEREPEIDLPSGDCDRSEVGDERARRDRMGEGEECRAHGVHGPPDRVPALDGAREQCAREQHRRERQRERLDRPRETDDAQRRREHERRGGAGVSSCQPPSEAIDRDRRDHGSDDRGEAHPLLGVVPGDERLEDGEVPRAGRIVRERPLEDVGERAVSGGDDRGLVDVERASSEPDEADDQRERGAEVGQRPIGDGEESSHEVVRAAGRISGVCRDTHRPSR